MNRRDIDISKQRELARQAAEGDKSARQQINELAAGMINYQNSRFCKRFCKENYFHYYCSLSSPLPGSSKDKALCEWGNASYGWMLNDLTGPKRLLKYEARHGASLFDYLYQIANSLPFYERWKDWRFSRRVHVPDYIKQLSPQAARVFLALRSADEIEKISQQIKYSLADTQTLCQKIIIELSQRKRLHLLNPATTTSLTQTAEEGGHQQDLASYDEAAETQQQKQRLYELWSELSVTEQFVLEAMVMDEQDAEDVLSALKKMNCSIKKGVAAQQTNIQQLYYFRRKLLARLAKKIS